MSNQVAVIDQLRQQLTAMQPQFKAALPSHVSPEKFVRVAMTAIQTNPQLQNADKRTLFAAFTRAAQDGLLPDGREAAIVMFGSNAQYMSMVAGLLKKVRNSGELSSLDAQVVYSGDQFRYRPGIDKVPEFEPDWFADRGEAIGAYAVAVMKDGAAYVEVMSKKQIEQVRSVSRSKGNGPWVTWWDEQARKTVIRRLSKRLPMSTDLDGSYDDEDPHFNQQSPEPVQAPAPVQPVDEVKEAPKRPSRLQKVVDEAPQDVPHDDGVIDVAPLESYEDESPI